jgi:hypothetical protein
MNRLRVRVRVRVRVRSLILPSESSKSLDREVLSGLVSERGLGLQERERYE